MCKATGRSDGGGMGGWHRLRRNYERVQILQQVRRNGRGAHKVHEILDALQVGLPNRSSLEHLRRGSGWHCVLGIPTAIGCLCRMRSKENRNEQGIGNQESQPWEETLTVSRFRSSVANRNKPDGRRETDRGTHARPSTPS